MRKTVLKKEPCLLSKQKAFQYQEEAFNSIKDLTYSGIFHEQGDGQKAGKDAAGICFRRDDGRICLVSSDTCH